MFDTGGYRPAILDLYEQASTELEIVEESHRETLFVLIDSIRRLKPLYAEFVSIRRVEPVYSKNRLERRLFALRGY